MKPNLTRAQLFELLMHGLKRHYPEIAMNADQTPPPKPSAPPIQELHEPVIPRRQDPQETVTPKELAVHASTMIQAAQNCTSLSLLQLAAVFRIAAASCDETSAMHERVGMVEKMRRWQMGR